MAELRRLAVPFGGLSDKMLACAFVVGLPDSVRQLLRAGSRMGELPHAHILTRARAVLTDEVGVAAAVSAMTVGAGASVKERMRRYCFSSVTSRIIWREVVCFVGKVAASPMAGVDEAMDEVVRDVIVVMAWVTLRRRVREKGTGRGRLC